MPRVQVNLATHLGRAVAKTAIVMGLLVLAYLFATVFATGESAAPYQSGWTFSEVSR